jgi:hypothetical protein
MKMLTFILILGFSFSSFAQEAQQPEQKTIYQYRKYDKFDLGSLELDGELLAPGDVTIRERERVRIKMDLFDRKRMGDFKRKDAQSLK